MKYPTVYLLASRPKGALYIGVTSDLGSRLEAHRSGQVEGFSRAYGIHNLVWYELHPDMESAIRREKALKKWRRAWKVRLIEAYNPQWRDLVDEIGP
jgi:putative endonuclease